jgi:mono/diheme cytochrome c family protein
MAKSKFVSLVVLLVAIASVQFANAQTAANTTVTFTKDIAPIFQEKCQACHRADSMAPMSLVTYEEARPWAKAIRERVITRSMPPWHINQTVGIQEFKNDRSLSDAQIATIVKWVDAGAPKGDPKDMPPAKKWPDESKWNLADMFGGPPDLIIKSPDWTVPAVAQDAWYKPVVDTGLTEPRWVRAIEIRPATVKGRKVTHHALARLQQEEKGDAAAIADAAALASGAGTAGLFMEWAVGKQGEIMRPNSGKLMLPGSKIIFEMHYHAVGEQITDHVELGIYLYPKGQEPKYRQTLAALQSVAGGSRNIDIPPNSTFMSQNFIPMRQAGRVENFQPHMHLRGKAMSMEAILPTGQTMMLSYVDHFNFNWMNNYVYADDAAPLLPKGTILKITSWYDNTASNPNNPDPNQWVGFGDRTVDEMGHAWVNITYMSDEDYQAEVAKKKAASAKSAALQQ